LRNGFEKMKKDCIRKYVTEQAAEPKKAKWAQLCPHGLSKYKHVLYASR
jgi:hypothetical protein